MAPFSVNQRQRRILAGLLAVVGLALWMQFLFLPKIATAGRLGNELKTLRTQVERARRDVAQMPSLEKKRSALASQYSAPEPTTPPEEQLPDLLEKIAQAARASHVRVTTLKPQRGLAQEQVAQSGYLEISLELAATAGYHQVGRFLDHLEQSENLVRLREVEIQPGSDDLMSHQVKMVLLAFLVPSSDAASTTSLRGTK